MLSIIPPRPPDPALWITRKPAGVRGEVYTYRIYLCCRRASTAVTHLDGSDFLPLAPNSGDGILQFQMRVPDTRRVERNSYCP